MNHWNCSRPSCRPRCPIQMPSSSKSKVCAFLHWFIVPESGTDLFLSFPSPPATVASPEIPNVEMLLHADCNDLEVMCEMSQYSVGRAQKRSGVAHFMVSVSVEATKFSIVLILQTVAVAEESTLVQNRLGLPLSLSGTLSTEGGDSPSSFLFCNNCFCPVTQVFFFCSSVVFLVFSQRNSVSAQLKSDAVLHCGFRQQEAQPAQDVGIEWRLQHKGKGWKVLQTETRLDGTEQSAVGECCVDGWRDGWMQCLVAFSYCISSAVREERQGSSINITQIVAEGDASVILTKLKVIDEGSYICSVSLGPFHAQQIIQLHLYRKYSFIWKHIRMLVWCFSWLLLQSRPRFHCHRRSWFLRKSLRPWVATVLNTILWMFRFVSDIWGVTWPGSLSDLPLLFRWSGCSSSPQTQSQLCPKTRVLCPVIDNTLTNLILCRLASPYPPLLLRELKSSVGFPIGLWTRLYPSACWSKVHKPVCSRPLLL